VPFHRISVRSYIRFRSGFPSLIRELRAVS
jgi:hypothetical protein